MLELNVTTLVNEVDCADFASSIAESGNKDIGKVTWENALSYVSDEPLVTGDDVDTVRDWLRGFGAWTGEELDAMSDREINAMLLQFVAGDIREMERFIDGHEPDDTEDSYEAFLAASEAGTVGGRLFRSTSDDWFFTVGD